MKVSAIDHSGIAKKPVKSVVTYNSESNKVEKCDFKESKKRIYSICIPLFLLSAITSVFVLSKLRKKL